MTSFDRVLREVADLPPAEAVEALTEFLREVLPSKQHSEKVRVQYGLTPRQSELVAALEKAEGFYDSKRLGLALYGFEGCARRQLNVLAKQANKRLAENGHQLRVRVKRYSGYYLENEHADHSRSPSGG